MVIVSVGNAVFFSAYLLDWALDLEIGYCGQKLFGAISMRSSDSIEICNISDSGAR